MKAGESRNGSRGSGRSGNTRRDSRWLAAALAALVAGWIALGWLDLPNETQAGFDTDGNGTIVRVRPGSPADVAGLQRGDVITRIGSYPPGDAGSIARLPRVAAGESRTFTIERDAEPRVIAVRYEALSPRALSLARASAIIGACFLLFPLLAFYRNPCRATRVLMIMGVGLSLAFADGPYTADAAIRALTTAVTTLFALVGLAAMAQFLLVFPHPRPWLERRTGKLLLYLPALVLWALLTYRILFKPAGGTVFHNATSLLAGAVFGGYFLASLFLMLRNYSRTDREERRALALNGMLWGTVAGLLPVTVAQLVLAFSPQAMLPGQDYYFVAVALVPLTWARSAGRIVR